MRRSRHIGVALFGLLVVAAISVAAGSGKKPAKEQQGTVSLRRISASEVMGILRSFPEIVSGVYSSRMNDTAFLGRVFRFSEVTSGTLQEAFPGARFYKGMDVNTLPQHPYLMAVVGDKRYRMPGRFNQMLLDAGMSVTDKNILMLARAFVLLAIAGEPVYNRLTKDPDNLDSLPPVSFLGAVKTKKLEAGRETPDAAILGVKTGEEVEEWHFSVLRNQFEGAARANRKGVIKNYDAVVVDPPPGRSQLIPPPDMAVETLPVGDAYVGYDANDRAHYYVIVDSNCTSANQGQSPYFRSRARAHLGRLGYERYCCSGSVLRGRPGDR
jgi:hypothetical protein